MIPLFLTGCIFSFKASTALEYIEEVVDEWEALGLALLLPYHVINAIRMNEESIESRRKELIRRWMCFTDLCGTACWWLLVRALEERSVNMNVAAARIRAEEGVYNYNYIIARIVIYIYGI